jgi:hypothetical protein
MTFSGGRILLIRFMVSIMLLSTIQRGRPGRRPG